jgi:hypothetical protein
MNEGNAEFLDPDLLKDAEATNQVPALASDAHELKTTRLPTISSPPPPVSNVPLPSFPPPEVAPSFSGTVEVAQSVQSVQPVMDRQQGEPAGKPSWLRGLLTTTFPPPPDTERTPRADAPIGANVAGTIFAALGMFFALIALVMGLRGAPMDPVAPIVAAALVLGRALVALGAGALSFAMFRQAERLLVRPRS